MEAFMNTRAHTDVQHHVETVFCELYKEFTLHDYDGNYLSFYLIIRYGNELLAQSNEMSLKKQVLDVYSQTPNSVTVSFCDGETLTFADIINRDDIQTILTLMYN